MLGPKWDTFIKHSTDRQTDRHITQGTSWRGDRKSVGIGKRDEMLSLNVIRCCAVITIMDSGGAQEALTIAKKALATDGLFGER